MISCVKIAFVSVMLFTGHARYSRAQDFVNDQVPAIFSVQPKGEFEFKLLAAKNEGITLEFEQDQINIGVTVTSPSSEVLVAQDRQRYLHVPEIVCFEAEEAGYYLIRLIPKAGYIIDTGLDENAFVWDGERRVPYETSMQGGEGGIKVSRKALPDLPARLDQLFEPYNRSCTAGVAVVVLKDGQVYYNKGFGLANLEYHIPVDGRTIFHMASVSKQFVGFALATLHHEQQLSLDDPVQKYIPELQVQTPITIRQLLQHTSGIRDQWLLLAMAGWRMDDVITQRQLLRMIYRQRKLNFEPGERFQYSNSNYTLGAEIIKRVTGRNLREWTSRFIFQPLSMTNTFFFDDHEEIVPNRAYSYDDRSGKVKKSVLSFSNMGATSLFTNSNDFVKWLMNFKTRKVGHAEVFDQFLERGRLNNGNRTNYALGIAVGEYKGKRVYNHSGVDAGYRTYMSYFPEEKSGVIILSNLASCNTVTLASQVADLLFDLPPTLENQQADGQKMIKRPEAAPNKQELVDIGGVYRNEELETQYVIVEKDGQFYLQHKRLNDVRLIRRPDGSYKGTYWVFNKVQFSHDDHGCVDGFMVSNGSVNIKFKKIK